MFTKIKRAKSILVKVVGTPLNDNEIYWINYLGSISFLENLY